MALSSFTCIGKPQQQAAAFSAGRWAFFGSIQYKQARREYPGGRSAPSRSLDDFIQQSHNQNHSN